MRCARCENSPESASRQSKDYSPTSADGITLPGHKHNYGTPLKNKLFILCSAHFHLTRAPRPPQFRGSSVGFPIRSVYFPFVPGVVPVSPGAEGFTRFSASFVCCCVSLGPGAGASTPSTLEGCVLLPPPSSNPIACSSSRISQPPPLGAQRPNTSMRKRHVTPEPSPHIFRRIS
jgi:hypothetical protein